MAIYTLSLSLPPGARNQRTTLSVGDSVVVRGYIRFPAGCSGLVGVRFLDREMQFAPLPGGTFVIGDDTLIEWPEQRQLAGAPYQVSMEGYNSDDTYTHTVTAYLAIMDKRYSDQRKVY